MNETEIITATEQFVKEQLLGEPTGHDWWHVMRVRNTARNIQSGEGGNLLVIDLALLLHDVGDRKVIKQENDDYTIAENFLHSLALEDTVIMDIMDIIKNMSFSSSLDAKPHAGERSIEFQIVQDADRLDALGAIGIARAFAFGGSRSRPLYDPEYEAQDFTSAAAYKQAQGSTFHHFAEKLFLLKDLLHTETAKAIASERDEYMHTFTERFLQEWEGQK